MTITIEQAKALRHGDVLHHDTHRNADGTCQRWRVTGMVKTWKRDAGRVSVPLKHGMWDYEHLTEDTVGLVHLEGECPRRK